MSLSGQNGVSSCNSINEPPNYHNFNTDPYLPSPKKRRGNNIPLKPIDRQTVIDIHKEVTESIPQESSHRKDYVVKKTAEAAGICRATVYNILKEHKTGSESTYTRKPRITRREYDDMTLGSIRRKIHTFYFNNELPVLDKILNIVNIDESLPNFSKFGLYRLLKKLKFKYVKHSLKGALVDKQEIILHRIKYLNDIKRLREEGRKIYYLDETWLNEESSNWSTTANKQECTSSDIAIKPSTGNGRCLIICHIGSSEGFLEGSEMIYESVHNGGNYPADMDAANFEKWFARILPFIETGSVIVMDNATYHSRQVEKVPTCMHTKVKMQEWLASKAIYFDETEVRAQLLLKIKKYKHLYEAYVVDEMAKEKGIIVLHLPPYHSMLNPVELILWSQVKGFIESNNKTSLIEIKATLPQVFSRITAERWDACIARVLSEEEKLHKLDYLIDDLVDAYFNTNAGESSCSSEDSE